MALSAMAFQRFTHGLLGGGGDCVRGEGGGTAAGAFAAACWAVPVQAGDVHGKKISTFVLEATDCA